ncbi:FecR family protein [Dyadobacter diqingensis]|uniref:FecR family protein n=1 Tax=Dyadobacter diqingensis TaxID=2938121 RepID=UPI0020C3389C|nr:FecR domain-containing protein [Dyadobacter diqingensis]
MKITNELLEKYAQGLCTPEEVTLVENWLADPASETCFPEGVDISKQGEMAWEAIREKSFDTEPVKVKSLPHSNVTRWLVAACMVFICGLAVFFSKRNEEQNAGSAAPKRYVTFKTKPGEKTRIKLKDGTLINLNADSELRVPENFDDSVRLVSLKGEAYLEVAKDPRHPFIVNTSDAKVRVLGTKFNVKNYPEEKTTTVVVREGKVQLSQASSEKEKLILTENERGQFNASFGLKEDNVYVNRYIGWKENKLVFDNQDMNDIARTIGRWYGIDVKLGSHHMGKQRFTGSFENQPASYVIEKICYVMDYKYKISDREISIY